MKKCLKLFILFLLLMPTIVFAKDKVNVYVFRGEGCPHCEELKDYLDGLDSETKSKFEVKDFEVWYNQDNAALMNRVAEARAEEVGGVPYIIVGNKSWNGFTSSFGDEILEEIKSEYSLAVAERHDMSAQIPELANGNVSENNSVKEEKKNNDAIALIIILAVTGTICFGIYKAREHSK